jgi:hypothetical protein
MSGVRERGSRSPPPNVRIQEESVPDDGNPQPGTSGAHAPTLVPR